MKMKIINLFFFLLMKDLSGLGCDPKNPKKLEQTLLEGID